MNSKKLFIPLWAGYVGFLLLWAIRFWGHFPALMDTLEYVFPEKWFNVQSYQAGLIPLWNPYIACGTPHVAQFQSAAFYPFFWIWNLTGLTNWFFVIALGHVVLAAVGFYFWLRSLKVIPLISVLCALSFSGSAYLTFLWGFPTHLASLAWIPWIFWASQTLLSRVSVGRWLGLIGFWALQILAGYPIFTFYALLFWVVFLMAHIGFNRKLWFFFVSALGCSLLVTACQWLPFLDFLGYMHREVWGSSLYNLNWAEYRTLLQPDALGVPGSADYKGDYGNFIFGNFYLGLLPLLILVWSLRQEKEKLNFWQKSLIFTLLLPLGSHFILWRFFPDSFWGKLEISKSSFLFVFCSFTALGFYLSRVFQKASKKNWFSKIAWVFILVWILDLVLVPFRIVHLIPDPYQNNEVKNFARKVGTMSGDGRVVTLRGEDRTYSPAVRDYAGSLQETANRLVPNTNVVWGIKSAQGHLTTVVDGVQNLSKYLREWFPYDGRVLDAAGVNLILTPKPLSAFKYHVSDSVDGSEMIRNAGAMPGDWVTEREKIFDQRAESFANLLNPKIFLENECDLDKGSNGQITALAPVSQGGPSVVHSPRVFQFNATSGVFRYFVFDQCFAPGWHAWVDGKPSPIFRADGLWMAVELGERGPHQIFFQYSPLSFRLGLFITLIMLTCLAALGARTWLKF